MAAVPAPSCVRSEPPLGLMSDKPNGEYESGGCVGVVGVKPLELDMGVVVGLPEKGMYFWSMPIGLDFE